jgi:hypothetical protein
VLQKNKVQIFVAVMLAVFMSGCATAGLRIIQAPSIKFGKFSTAGILVTDNVSTNKLAVLIEKRYKTIQATSAERQMVKTMLISRLMSENKFSKVYDYDEKGPRAQLFMDVTIKKFDFNENDYFVILDGSVYSNMFNLGDIAVSSKEQTANLLINVVFYNESDMTRICELDLIVLKERLDGTHSDFGEGYAFKNYEEYLVSRAIDQLMGFLHNN